MALSGTSSIRLVDPRDLLEMLRQHPLTAPFNLALYAEQQGRGGLIRAIDTVCSPPGEERLCSSECYQGWDESIAQAKASNQPVTRCCAKGYLYFIVPLPEGRSLPDCLIGGGVLAHRGTTNRSMTEELQSIPDNLHIESWESPQPVNLQDAEATSAEIFRSLPRLLDQQVNTLCLDRTTKRLEAVQKLARDLVDCAESEKAVSLISEALVVLFNLPRILIVLLHPGPSLAIHSTLGLDPDTFQIDQKRLFDYFARMSGHPEAFSKDQLGSCFPGIETQTALLFPLQEENSLLGAIVILDIELHSRDLALIELLVNRLATRLGNLRAAAEHKEERRFSSRIVSMISALSLVESRQELYQQILEMSAELLNATSGSFMLLNEADATLTIEAAMGMTPSLAKAMSIACGEGIAGRVAKSGFPMLVNDIERDNRVATRNRPRFKTKSFISMPLDVEGRLVGVLNLADKGNGSHFTEADLNLAQTFTSHAVLMIDRAATLEKAGQFEKLAITDPLTGLYNRRFLEDRLQQEFSRGERQKQSFCIVLADLDSFKVYNDICGHLAGDNALRKVAEIMRRSAREMDVVTRYGGEEFCLVLPGTKKKESVFVGERIRRAIEAENFPGESHLPLGKLTISIGIAIFPTDGVNANELIHAADLALYSAKKLGRNRLVLYEPSLQGRALHLQND